MKIEVILTYWGDYEISKVVRDAWDNQTDKDFKLNFLKLGFPLYRNISLLKAVKESDADVIFITDGDIIYKKDSIEKLKLSDLKDDTLYYYNRLMLSEETSSLIKEFKLLPENVEAKNDIRSNEIEFRGKEDNNFPHAPGAFGYCQIAYKSLLEKIIPSFPIIGWTIYDSYIQKAAPNVMLDVCYHLSHKSNGQSTVNKPAKMIIQSMTREDFGPLFNKYGLTGLGLELGVQKGEFSEHIVRKWKGQHLFLVDIWEHQSETDYVDIANVSTEEHLKNMMETINRINKHVDTDSVSVWRSNSRVASNVFKDNMLDWVYLDANHSYLDTKLDINRWYHKVKSGGIISGDDWDMPAVNKAVYETILALGNDITVIVTSYGNRSWYFFKP